MALVYFDSGALVKLIIDEEGSAIAAELWDRCDAALSSRLAYPEVHAAIAAARRDRRLDDSGQAVADASWERYWAAVRVVELSRSVANHAGLLAGEHALRGADAVHLASLLAVGPGVVMAVWDVRLASAARKLGVMVAGAVTG